MDFNGDGNIDLLAAGFIGYSYIFYGSQKNTFVAQNTLDTYVPGMTSSNASEIIIDKNGNKIRFGIYWIDKVGWIYSAQEKFIKFPDLTAEEKKKLLDIEDVCILTKAVDWDNDGDMDLVLSGRNIGARLCMNEGSSTKAVFSSEFIPVITTKNHHADALIDWDGDGLFDILSGSKEGGVYFYKNYGKLGTPLFKEYECLIDSESLIAGKLGGKCDLTMLSASDYNNDGKLDLIIGNKCILNLPAPKLSAEQIAERDELLEKRAKISEKMDLMNDSYKEKFGFLKTKMMEARKKDKKYQEIRDKYFAVSKQLFKLLPRKKSHGYVWVSLRK